MPCVDVEPAAVRLLKPASTPIKEHLPSFPRRLKLPLVVIPTNAVFPDDIFFIASILAPKSDISESTLSSIPNIEAIVFAFLDTLFTSPSLVSVARYTTGAISLKAS